MQMPIMLMRFDLRRPDFATASHHELYRAALNMSEWAEQQGFAIIVVSEHHGADDGYLPSPTVMAGAVAARTNTIQIHMAALVAPLHDPVQLAEDIAVLDNLSGGRVTPVLSAGYREEEFLAIGKTLKDRKAYMDKIVPFLELAWKGEAFEFEGRKIRITPTPHSQPRPMIFMGGSTHAAARRAAKYADYFMLADAEIFETYREGKIALGQPDPGPLPPQAATVFFVAENPDEYWDKIAPHLMHEQHSYAEWADKAGVYSPYSFYANADELRDDTLKYQVLSPAGMLQHIEGMIPGQAMGFSPLVGGLHPDTSWQSLQLLAEKVLPELKA